MRNRKLDVITCPFCGREYLPSEIYLPDSFLGKATNVMRMADGTIETFFGKNMDLKESYRCDKCDSEFDVQAKVTFKSFPHEDKSFKEEYVTKISRLKLSEE